MTKLQISEARVERKNFLMDELIERIRDGRIDLAPSFRTNINKWSAEQESLFIESLLLQIPIPAFYVDASDHERWLIVDGQQRLNTIRKFLDDELVLDGLEFLRQKVQRASQTRSEAYRQHGDRDQPDTTRRVRSGQALPLSALSRGPG